MKKCGGMASVRKMAELLDSRPVVATSNDPVVESSRVDATNVFDPSFSSGVVATTSIGIGVPETGNGEHTDPDFDLSRELREDMMDDEVSLMTTSCMMMMVFGMATPMTNRWCGGGPTSHTVV
jgi:hypothetical protein